MKDLGESLSEIAVVVGTFFIGIALILLLAVLVAWPFQFLWNWLVTSLFGMREITLWESLGLLCLLSFFKPSGCKCGKKEK